MSSSQTQKVFLPSKLVGDISQFEQLGFSFPREAALDSNGFIETVLPDNCKIHEDPKFTDRAIVVNTTDKKILAEVFYLQAAAELGQAPFLRLATLDRVYNLESRQRPKAPWEN